MKYYRPANLDNWEEISQEILKLVSPKAFWEKVRFEVYPLDQFQKISLLRESLQKLGLYDCWTYVSVISTPPGNFGVHLDSKNKMLALNIPLYNCKGSSTCFFDLKDGVVIPEAKTPVQREVYYPIDENDVIEVERFELSTPAFIRINVPHTVLNPSDKTRITCSLRFNPEPIIFPEQKI